MSLDVEHREPRLRTRALALAMVIAPPLLIAGLLTDPSGSTHREYMKAIGEAPGQAALGAVLLHSAMLLMVAASFGVAAQLRSARPTLAWIGSTLTTLGFGTVNGLVAYDFWDLALMDRLPLEQAVSISAQAEASPALVGAFFVPAFVGCLGGTATLVFGLVRARLLVWPLAVTMPLGVFVFFGGGDTIVMSVVGAALMGTVPLLLGLRSLGSQDS